MDQGTSTILMLVVLFALMYLSKAVRSPNN